MMSVVDALLQYSSETMRAVINSLDRALAGSVTLKDHYLHVRVGVKWSVPMLKPAHDCLLQDVIHSALGFPSPTSPIDTISAEVAPKPMGFLKSNDFGGESVSLLLTTSDGTGAWDSIDNQAADHQGQPPIGTADGLPTPLANTIETTEIRSEYKSYDDSPVQLSVLLQNLDLVWSYPWDTSHRNDEDCSVWAWTQCADTNIETRHRLRQFIARRLQMRDPVATNFEAAQD